MKIRLADNKEITIKRATKMYHAEDSRYELSVIIDSSVNSMEDVIAMVTEDNTKVVTLIRDNLDDIVYTNLNFTFSSENISETQQELSLFFDMDPTDTSPVDVTE